MQLRLQSTRGYSVANGVKILVYGRAGTGKTTLCATMPSPVVFSAESGLLALARHDIPYYPIAKLSDLVDAYNWSRDSAEARQFQSICVDSISEIAEVFLASVLVNKKDPRQAYGEMITGMTKTVRDFRDLPGKNVYMSAKQASVLDVANVRMNGPAMPGTKLGEAMPYFPDEVFQAAIEGTGPASYHYLRCRPDFSNDAKDRSGALEEKEEPHLGKIIQKIARASGLVP